MDRISCLYIYTNTINKIDKDKTLNIKTATSKFSPNISQGRKLENIDEIICPRYLRVSKTATSTNDTINMEVYLGDELTLSYDRLFWENAYQPSLDKEFVKKVKLVGIYDNVLSLETYNECYMLEDIVRDMFLESESVYSEAFLKNNFVYSDGTATEVIVDELENMEFVKEELTNAGYTVQISGINFDWDFINKVKIFSIIGFFVLLFLIFVIFLLYISIFLKKQKKHIALYKTFGYRNKDISLLFKIQLLYYTIFSYILSLGILQIGIIIVNNIISKSLEYFYINLAVSYLYELIYLAFLFSILFFVSNIVNKKIYSYTIRELFNNVDI